MAKKKTEVQEVQEVQEEKVEVITEIEKKITLLEERIASLNKQIDKAEIELKKISVVAVNYDKMVKTVDNLFVADLTNRYGFDGEMMYYIGAASSTMYKKPINEEIVDLISRIDTLDWKGIQKINKHFMKK